MTEDPREESGEPEVPAADPSAEQTDAPAPSPPSAEAVDDAEAAGEGAEGAASKPDPTAPPLAESPVPEPSAETPSRVEAPPPETPPVDASDDEEAD
ncbi:MAG: hypothetical protein H0U79_05290, partial [Solirubrobacterales bacterium]|nr:hypothetical protein [Solirubrobacterales bacterium]